MRAQEPQNKPAESKPAPDVFVIKAPEPPPSPPVQKPALTAQQLESRPPLNDGTKMQLIQLLDAEMVHTRKMLPLGDKSTIIGPDGQVKPGDAALFELAQSRGAAARIGDKVQITNISIKEKMVYVEINGGPKKKSKWYDHISIGMGAGGGMNSTDPNQAAATGSAVTLQFSKHVPEMTGEELKKLLSPVLDFGVKTAAEVYIDTMPPKVKAAMKNHEVLVGMNKDMVIMAKERPQQRTREKDEAGNEYEEWIYGQPPQDVVFVRFKGENVVQVKTAKVGGEMLVKTEKEVDVHDGVVTLAALQASSSPQDVKPVSPEEEARAKAPRPTLHRQGEDGSDVQKVSRQPIPVGADGHPDEPQWGQDKGGSGSSQPAGSENKPPR
ncbi:MAG TPA: hypothetical protein VE783_09005 [Candidatus Limnocylindrales bacterium]|nr:hypothetical protein [Candidatus Limnocylindrales bacterium]